MRLLVIYSYFYPVTKQRENFRECFEFGTKPLWRTFKTHDSKEKKKEKNTHLDIVHLLSYV